MWKVTTKSPTPTSPFAPIPAQPTDLKKVEVAAAKKKVRWISCRRGASEIDLRWSVPGEELAEGRDDPSQNWISFAAEIALFTYLFGAFTQTQRNRERKRKSATEEFSATKVHV